MIPYTEILRNRKVLIVDDNALNIYALGHFLKGLDMEVLIASDAREAMELIEKNEGVEMILMDMMMPGMDGYTAIGKLRSETAAASIPIIAVTANAMKGDKEKCLAAGASEYVSKPIDLAELTKKMAQLLQHSAS